MSSLILALFLNASILLILPTCVTVVARFFHSGPSSILESLLIKTFPLHSTPLINVTVLSSNSDILLEGMKDVKFVLF
jgi:hypothetical protein